MCKNQMQGTGTNRSEVEVRFRPLNEADLPTLTEWLARPHIVEWWGGADEVMDLEGIREKYLPRMDENSSVRCYIAELNGHAIGFIQSYVAVACGGGWWEDEADPGVHGIDQFLADGTKLGKGLGTQMVRAFARRLLADPSVTKVQVDPSPANVRAIRCYEKAGFVPVEEIVTPDGPVLLMVTTREQNPTAGDAAHNQIER